MKYYIPSGTELYSKASDILDRAQQVHDHVQAFARERFGSSTYVKGPNHLAGSPVAFSLGEKPTGWMHVFKYIDKNLYFPKKISANKELLKEIDSLPSVPNEQLKHVLGYGGYFVDGKYSGFPGIVYKPDNGVILVSVSEWVPYSPPNGIIEITVSDYNALKSGIGDSPILKQLKPMADLPGWLQELWNLSPTLARQAERYIENLKINQDGNN